MREIGKLSKIDNRDELFCAKLGHIYMTLGLPHYSSKLLCHDSKLFDERSDV